MALLAVGLALSVFTGWTPEAAAHHGFTGAYDFCRPVYIEGTVTSVRYGYPHAEFTVDVPRDLALPQNPRARADLRALAEAEDRDTLSMLVLPQTRGPMMILLEPVMTGTVTERRRPRVGDRVTAVAYQRVSDDRYRGELRVILLSLGDGGVVMASRPRSYHRGCR
jgi:hypothetical protein